MRVALDMTGRLLLLDAAGTWRLDLSTGGLSTVHVVERVVVDPATGRLAVIVLAPK